MAEAGGLSTYLHKSLESKIGRHFLINSVCAYRIIRHIFEVGISPVYRSVEKWGCNAVDVWMLVPLNFVEGLDQPFVMLQNFFVIVEDVLNELLHPVDWNDWGVCFPQRFDKNLGRL